MPNVQEELLRNFTERLLKHDAFLWVARSEHEALGQRPIEL